VKVKVFISPLALLLSLPFLGLFSACGSGGGSSSQPVQNPVAPALTWSTPAAVTTGTALGAAQLDATANVPGTFTYSPAAGTILTAVGTTTLSVTFTPTDSSSYATATATVSLSVTAGTPVIAWPTPAPVPVGTVLGATQLDATAGIKGTFAYTPAAGTTMSAIGSTKLSVTFTPADTVDYNTATASVTLTVNQATPVVTWNTPAAVPVGTALSVTQLDATASVPGTFTYSPALGTVMSVAGTSTLSVNFVPTDSIDYASVTQTVKLTVSGTTAPPSYAWGNVKIVAGGYVSGLYFHPNQKGLMYARTDMGGAYRWGPNDAQWVPLTDWIDPSVWWYGGVEAIGLDPADPNRLYLAVGEYANENWDGNGAMLVSDDQGATFTTVPLGFKNGSNDNGRNTGERMAVDPNTPATVYFGTRVAGLQISTNHGSTWNQVTGLPVTSTANGNGVVSVIPVSASGATKAVYVAAAGTGVGTSPVGLYVSTNPGSVSSTFTAVTGQPSFATATTPLAPLHAILGPNGNLYVLYGDGTGPNGITTSQLWEFAPGSNWTSGTWKQIAIPPNSKGDLGDSGYGGIAADPNHAGVLLLATIDDWYPGDTIYRTTNDGATWTDVSAFGGTHDATLSPYLTFGSGPVTNVGSGNWVGSISIDPFNSDHAMYGTGATIWSTTDLTGADTGQNVDWTVGANGVEETAVGMVLAPPSGSTLLLSGMGDIYGFAHTDLTKSPVQGMWSNPRSSPSSIDFEQGTPTTVVRITNGTTPYGVLSSDGGMTWTAFATNPRGTATGGGTAAIAPDGSSLVWAPADTSSVWYSTNLGATWTASSGIPAQAQVVSDRVKAGVFYGFSGGSIYMSTNQGQTWTALQSSLPGDGNLVILPDAQGDLWLNSKSSGLYSNTGTAGAPALTALPGVSGATYFSFGKGASGGNFLTLYLYGTSNGTLGLFRSIDNGATWTQINDAAHKWGGGLGCVTGDMRTFGTVYLCGGGRGILWGTSTN